MKILITGATGFIGSHLAECFHGEGDQVRVLVRPGHDLSRYAKSGMEVVTGDLEDSSALALACRDREIVIHAAALVSDWSPRRLYDTITVQGTRNICQAAAAARVRQFIHLSTNDVFGYTEKDVITEDHTLEPWGEPYPDAKIAAEKIVWEHHHSGKFQASVVYPCWCYGERDYHFITDMTDAVLRRDMLFWRRDALCWPVYVGNVASLVYRISREPRSYGQGFLVHDGVCFTLRKFCALITRHFGVREITTTIPRGLAMLTARLFEAWYRLLSRTRRPLLTTYIVKNFGSRLRFSIDKAQQLLDWVPETSFEQGFSRTMDWVSGLDRVKTLLHKSDRKLRLYK